MSRILQVLAHQHRSDTMFKTSPSYKSSLNYLEHPGNGDPGDQALGSVV